jgi:hypothetical protein
LTDFTFEFIRRPTPLILSPSYWTFVELTLVTRARPDNKAVDPDATMAELEQEHRDWECELLAPISDLEDRARSYEQRLDELSSTNTGLREALRNQEA